MLRAMVPLGCNLYSRLAWCLYYLHLLMLSTGTSFPFRCGERMTHYKWVLWKSVFKVILAFPRAAELCCSVFFAEISYFLAKPFFFRWIVCSWWAECFMCTSSCLVFCQSPLELYFRLCDFAFLSSLKVERTQEARMCFCSFLLFEVEWWETGGFHVFWILAFHLLLAILIAKNDTDTLKLLYALDRNTDASSLICGNFFPKTDLCLLQLKQDSGD